MDVRAATHFEVEWQLVAMIVHVGSFGIHGPS